MCVFKRICLKDNYKPAHWVGHCKIISLDIDEFFKITPKFDENRASVTGNTEKKENVSEKTTDDGDENSEENKIVHKNKDKVGTIEEDNKVLEYQE